MSKRTGGIENIDVLKNNEEENVQAEAPNKAEAEAPNDAEAEAPNDSESKPEAPTTTGYEKVIGIVSEECDALNVRHEPNTDCEIVGVLRAGSEVIIYEDGSSEEFYKICTSAGIDGYCMRQYITLK